MTSIEILMIVLSFLNMTGAITNRFGYKKDNSDNISAIAGWFCCAMLAANL